MLVALLKRFNTHRAIKYNSNCRCQLRRTMMVKGPFIYVLLLHLVLLLSACSTVAPEVAKRRFLFPPPPAEARIEYLQGYFSDHDLKPSKKDFFTENVIEEIEVEVPVEVEVEVEVIKEVYIEKEDSSDPKCPWCDKEFKSKKTLTTHCRKFHLKED